MAEYSLPHGDGFRVYQIPDRELSDRTLQARRRDPGCTYRQAKSRALAAAREARDLNELLKR